MTPDYRQKPLGNKGRGQRIGNGVVRGTNLLMAIFWTAVGIGCLIAAGKHIGGAGSAVVGIGALLYGLYGFYRVLF